MNLIFVGGIHGVGKTTFCRELAPVVNARHVTAGELIRMAQRKGAILGKAVDDVRTNQSLLLRALDELRPTVPAILLDGHYTLINSCLKIETIALEVFRALNPAACLLLTADPVVARARLIQRDGTNYDLALLREHDQLERIHARNVSDSLGVPLALIGDAAAVSDATKFLATTIKVRG